ncbi:MAG: type II toxin-antitoxin system prevent-host-death family antitoxin [Myxococcota bacterium]
MAQVDIQDAKTYLSKLLAQVRSGEEVVLASRGKPFAKIIPYEESKSRAEWMGADIDSVSWDGDIEAPVPPEYLLPFYEE